MKFLKWLFRSSQREPLVSELMSKNLSIRHEALKEVFALLKAGDSRGLLALEEAIRIKSGRRNVKFFKPGFTVRMMTDYARARDSIIELAQRHALLADPEASGNQISAFLTFYGEEMVHDLAKRVQEVGGEDQEHALELLLNQMRAWVILNRPDVIEDLKLRQKKTES